MAEEETKKDTLILLNDILSFLTTHLENTNLNNHAKETKKSLVARVTRLKMTMEPDEAVYEFEDGEEEEDNYYEDALNPTIVNKNNNNNQFKSNDNLMNNQNNNNNNNNKNNKTTRSSLSLQEENAVNHIHNYNNNNNKNNNNTSRRTSRISSEADGIYMSPKELKGISMQGYLYKKSNTTKGMLGMVLTKITNPLAKKYCVLRDGCMLLYDSNNSKRTHAVIKLAGYEVRRSGKNSFDLVCPGLKSHFFDAQKNAEKWVEKVKKECSKEPGMANNESEEEEEEDDEDTYDDAGDACRIVSSDKNSLVPSETELELYEDVFPTKPLDQNGGVAPEVQEEDQEEDFYEEEEYVDVAEEKIPAKQLEVKKINKNGDKPLPKTPPLSPDNGNLPYDRMYYCKWDTLADGKDELDLKFGDVVTLLSRKYEDFGWWVGKGEGGCVGLVPKDYLTPAYRLVT